MSSKIEQSQPNGLAREKREAEKKLADATKITISRSIKISFAGTDDHLDYGKLWVITKDGIIADYTISKAIGIDPRVQGKYVLNPTADVKELMIRRTNPEQKQFDDARMLHEVTLLKEKGVVDDGGIICGPELKGQSYLQWDARAKAALEVKNQTDLKQLRSEVKDRKIRVAFKKDTDFEKFFSPEEKKFSDKLRGVKNEEFMKKLEEVCPSTYITRAGFGANLRDQSLIHGVRHDQTLNRVCDQVGQIVVKTLTSSSLTTPVTPSVSSFSTTEVEQLKLRIKLLENAAKAAAPISIGNADLNKLRDEIQAVTERDEHHVHELNNLINEVETWRQETLDTLSKERALNMKLRLAYEKVCQDAKIMAVEFPGIDPGPSEVLDLADNLPAWLDGYTI